MCGVGGAGGPPPENFGIFELPRLDFLQFQYDFRSFSDKKGLLLGGSKTLQWGANTGAGGGGGFGPSSICVKRGPDHDNRTYCVKHVPCQVFSFILLY